MPTVDFTIDDLKQLFATKADLASFATKSDLAGFATKSDLERFATKTDLERFATKSDLERFATKEDLRDEIRIVVHEITKVRNMLEEDMLAESKRLDMVDRRSRMTQKLLDQHILESAGERERRD